MSQAAQPLRPAGARSALPVPARSSVAGLGGPTAPVQLLDPRAVYSALGSSPRGLSSDEVAGRLSRTGPNELPPARPRSVLSELAAQFTNMFSLVLMVASGLTFLTWLLSTPRSASNLELAFGILAVVVLNAGIGFAQEHSAERAAEALQAMVPATARVVREGELCEVPAAALVPGDLVVLDAGDAVPADCRLVEAHDLLVEMAALTGESRPTPRAAEGVADGVDLHEAVNCLFMGTSLLNGSGRAVVSLLAKRLFAVPRVLARVNDLANRWMFDASWGVDEVVAPATLLASLVVAGEPQGMIAAVTG